MNNDNNYFSKESTLQAEAVAIHFERDFLGKTFFQVPEMEKMRHLLDLASQGIKFEDVEDSLNVRIKDLINV